MARIRTVKPEFWESEDTSSLGVMAALTYVGMWNYADDEGRGKAGTAYLHTRLHWNRPGATVKTTQEAIDELVERKFIVLYTGEDGHPYYHVPTLLKHQVINRPTESKLPPPNTHGVLTESSLLEGKGKEGKGKDSAEPAGAPDSAPPVELSGLALYETDWKLCKRWTELLKGWKSAFPGVNVLGEVRKAHAWEVANPTRVKKDRPRFLYTWLSRAQDQARGPTPLSMTDANGKTKCLNCGGSGKVADGIAIGGGIKLVDCRHCQKKGALA